MSKKNSDLIDIAGLARRYTARWYWFAISVICCCAIGFLFSRTIKPKYEVRAKILLSEQGGGMSKLMAGGLSGVSDLLGGNSNAEDEVDILMSHTVLRNVARQMGLNRSHYVRVMPMVRRFAYNDFPVDVLPDESIKIDTLRTGILFAVNVHKDGEASVKVMAKGKTILKKSGLTLPYVAELPYGRFTIAATDYMPKNKDVSTTISVCSYDDAAESLRKQVDAGLASKHSSIIELMMTTDNEEYACDVLNALIAKYNSRSENEQKETTSATADFLRDRVAMIHNGLTATEAQIASYKQSEGIADLQADGAVLYEGMKKTEQALQEAEIAQRLSQIMLEMVKASAKDNSTIPVQGDPAVAELIGNYNRLIMRRLRMTESARPDNPALQALDEQIRTARANLIASLESAVKLQNNTVSEIRSFYNANIGKVTGIPSQEKTYRAIERERTIQEEIYLFLLQKQEETAILLSNITPSGTVVDAAYSLNEDKSVSTKAILAIAFVLGLMIPPLVMMGLRFVRRRFDGSDEVEARTDIPVIGEICEDKSGEALLVKPGAVSPAAEMFRLLRSNLQAAMRESAAKVVLVTSAATGEGKTFIAANLAASFALMGKRTLLVGIDIRHPRPGEFLGLSPRHGLTDLLVNPSLNPSDAIMHDAVVSGLDVLAAGSVSPNPAEMLSSEEIRLLIDKLRERYDYIIIDAAPVGAVSDTFLISGLADVTLYVVRANHSRLDEVDLASRLNAARRLPRMAIVVNGTKESAVCGY